MSKSVAEWDAIIAMLDNETTQDVDFAAMLHDLQETLKQLDVKQMGGS